ncbi:MAG: hypothetical protein MJB12_11875 [Firmicutes bacterium]|nr:hypothetical protein [Bacillota bacterium]
MVNDLISVFGKLGNDKMIIDVYKPAPGLYLKINKNFEWEEPFIMTRKQEDTTSQQYRWFREADYYSKLIDMNKSVDPKKKIHSNNYLALFIKREILPVVGDAGKRITKEIFQESIERYFNVFLKSDEERYRDHKTLELIGTLDLPEISAECVQKNMNFIINNMNRLISIIQETAFNKKEYIKIFFEEDLAVYKQENERYVIPKIFNKNDYNVLIKDKILGLSNDNMGLNAKKPYLQHHGTQFKVAFRIDVNAALTSKKIFEWLDCQSKNEIYIPEQLNNPEDIEDILIRDLTKTSGDGAYYYIYFTRGKGITIEDFDYIPNIRENVDFKFKNYLNVKGMDEEEFITKNYELETLIDEYFFNKRLKNAYYILPKVKSGEFTKRMLSLLIMSRKAFQQFLKKSDQRAIKSIIDKVSLGLVKEQLLLSDKVSSLKAAKAYNLRLSLLTYLDIKVRGVNMGSRILAMMSEISEKLNSKETKLIETDEEFYFIAGQLAYYLLFQSEKKDKSYDMAEPFFRSSNAKRLKNHLAKVCKKYSHRVGFNHIRTKNAISMVMDYATDSRFIDYEDIFLAGFMANNLLLAK